MTRYLSLSVPLNVRKTLCGEQGRQICLAAVQEAQHTWEPAGQGLGQSWAEAELDLPCLLAEVGSPCEHSPSQGCPKDQLFPRGCVSLWGGSGWHRGMWGC